MICGHIHGKIVQKKIEIQKFLHFGAETFLFDDFVLC